jgi:hypothetical protein
MGAPQAPSATRVKELIQCLDELHQNALALGSRMDALYEDAVAFGARIQAPPLRPPQRRVARAGAGRRAFRHILQSTGALLWKAASLRKVRT